MESNRETKVVSVCVRLCTIDPRLKITPAEFNHFRHEAKCNSSVSPATGSSVEGPRQSTTRQVSYEHNELRKSLRLGVSKSRKNGTERCARRYEQYPAAHVTCASYATELHIRYIIVPLISCPGALHAKLPTFCWGVQSVIQRFHTSENPTHLNSSQLIFAQR